MQACIYTGSVNMQGDFACDAVVLDECERAYKDAEKWGVGGGAARDVFCSTWNCFALARTIGTAFPVNVAP